MKTTLRILALALALLVLTLCFAACGDKGGSDSDLVFVTPNGVTLAIGAPADKAVTTLGDWVSMNSSDSCGGFSGKDYLYTYHGFRMSTTPAKDGQIICKVELTDDSVKTPQGLYIGMSRADAEAAMKGYKAESVGDNLVYTSGSAKLQVVFRDGSVTGIIYVAA
ncbi:MAG: hypothetical protein J6B24_12370 [Clostridia bacterium]|nr:hypothetical protein [Clostridia bacterium]